MHASLRGYIEMVTDYLADAPALVSDLASAATEAPGFTEDAVSFVVCTPDLTSDTACDFTSLAVAVAADTV